MTKRQNLVEVEKGVIPQKGIVARHYGLGDEDENRSKHRERRSKDPVHYHDGKQCQTGRRC